MKSRITKFGAAAVIIIAAALVLHNGSVDLTSPAFAQMTENMKKMPWIHIIAEGQYQGKAAKAEQWYGLDSQVIATKDPDGKVSFHSFSRFREITYDPDTNAVVVRRRVTDFPHIPRQWQMYEQQFMTHQPGTQIIHTQDTLEHRQVDIYRLTWTNNDLRQEYQITVDCERDLPISALVIVEDVNGTVTTHGRLFFSYPDAGPKTIYDLGVPLSARAPSPEVVDVEDNYWMHRENAPSTYIAVELEARGAQNTVDWVHAFYKDGNIWREEFWSASSTRQKWSALLSQNQLDIDDVLDLAYQGGQNYIWLKLFDGSKLYSTRSDNGGQWKTDTRNLPGPDTSGRRDVLVRIGWPRLNLWRPNLVRAEIIETDYSAANNLICIEVLLEGRKQENGSFELPCRELFYINPERDYICQRHEQHCDPNAEWQADVAWRENLDPDQITLRTNSFIDEVTRFGQTESRKWFPLNVETRIASHRPDTLEFVPLHLNHIKYLWLECEPDFAEGIFDPNTIPPVKP